MRQDGRQVEIKVPVLGRLRCRMHHGRPDRAQPDDLADRARRQAREVLVRVFLRARPGRRRTARHPVILIVVMQRRCPKQVELQEQQPARDTPLKP